jgi:hypothetical protein
MWVAQTSAAFVMTKRAGASTIVMTLSRFYRVGTPALMGRSQPKGYVATVLRAMKTGHAWSALPQMTSAFLRQPQLPRIPFRSLPLLRLWISLWLRQLPLTSPHTSQPHLPRTSPHTSQLRLPLMSPLTSPQTVSHRDQHPPLQLRKMGTQRSPHVLNQIKPSKICLPLFSSYVARLSTCAPGRGEGSTEIVTCIRCNQHTPVSKMKLFLKGVSVDLHMFECVF